MTEKTKIQEEYKKYQKESIGLDVYEIHAFKAGWLAAKNFFQSDVSGRSELLSNFNNTLARHQERLSDDVKIQWNELYQKLLNSH